MSKLQFISVHQRRAFYHSESSLMRAIGLAHIYTILIKALEEVCALQSALKFEIEEGILVVIIHMVTLDLNPA